MRQFASKNFARGEKGSFLRRDASSHSVLPRDVTIVQTRRLVIGGNLKRLVSQRCLVAHGLSALSLRLMPFSLITSRQICVFLAYGRDKTDPRLSYVRDGRSRREVETLTVPLSMS